MFGIAAPVLGIKFSDYIVDNQFQAAATADTDSCSKQKFREQFAADSHEAGLVRTMKEKCLQAERLYAEKNLDAAMESYEQMAHSAKELGDRASEAVAVLGLANCLANAETETVDVELVCSMYRYAGEAAEESGDADVRFSALVGCAKIRWSCRMFERSEKLWEAAVDLAAATGNWEHSTCAKSQFAKTLLEGYRDVIDENKNDGHITSDTLKPQFRMGGSPKVERALKLLEEVIAELPDSASIAKRVSAKVNLASVLSTKTTTKSKKRAEDELVSALDLLAASGGDPQTQQTIESSLLELYEENIWLIDGRPEAKARMASLAAKKEASRKHAHAKDNLMAILRKPTHPEERYIHEKVAWAEQKLEAMKRRQDDDADSDSDRDAAPARPCGDGWQR